jgi:hypothetical protein
MYMITPSMSIDRYNLQFDFFVADMVAVLVRWKLVLVCVEMEVFFTVVCVEIEHQQP